MGMIVETIASSQDACSVAFAWDHAVLGDVSENLQGILQHVNGKETPKSSWHFQVSKPLPLPIRPRYESSAQFCHPEDFFSSFNRAFVSPESVVSVDVGDVTVWTARCLRLMPGARLLSSQRLGTMGYGLCGAIAVKLHSPDSRCAAICGDGGFAMSLTELAVASQHNLGILVVVFNNAKMARVVYGSTQDVANAGTDLVNPDFVDLANAYGGHGIRIDGAADIDSCLEEAIRYTEAGVFVILDVRMDPELRAPFCVAGEMEASGLI
jgi:thiamine pyrophosphate-dependent acetolactate synthase large subunit-like protein